MRKGGHGLSDVDLSKFYIVRRTMRVSEIDEFEDLPSSDILSWKKKSRDLQARRARFLQERLA